MLIEAQVESIIRKILDYRDQGITDSKEIMARLESGYKQYDIDFEWFLEMMSTGAFRAGIMMSGNRFPASNIDDNIVLRTAFKMYWIEQKGKEDYLKNFTVQKKKWWQPFK